jgi:hypothetical protein
MRPTRTAALAAALLVAAGASAGHVSAQPTSEPAPSPSPSAEAAPPSEDATPPGPKTTIDADGTYSVGTDIVPGVYSSAGPIPDGTACYWKRMNGDELVDNALTKKPAVVQVLANDTTFTTNDCQSWALTDAPLPRQSAPTEILGQLGKLIITGPTGPPAQSAQSAQSAPAAEVPAAQAPAADAPAAAEAPTEHLAPAGQPPGP